MSAQSNSIENFIPEYFKDFIWTDIQNFSLITSKNGIGKSKLLKLIRYRFNKSSLSNINVEFSDLKKLKKFEILNTTDNSDISKPISSSQSVTQSNASHSIIPNKNELKCHLIHFDGNFHDLKGEKYDENKRNTEAKHKEIHFFKIQNDEISDDLQLFQINGLINFILDTEILDTKILNGKLKGIFENSLEIVNPGNQDNNEFKIMNFDVSGDNIDNCDIIDYSIEKVERIENDVKKQNFKISIKTKSNSNGFTINPGNVCNIETTNHIEKYQIKRRNKDIYIRDLSCGEQIILYLKLWSIIANDDILKQRFQKNFGNILLLLEEPDSFLNPGILYDVVKIIKEDIVGKLNVQVMMTTHNTITISFVEILSSMENIIVLKLENGSQKLNIEKFKDKIEFSKLIHNELNSNLINVYLPFKIIFIEGNDAEFYKKFFNFLLKNNPDFSNTNIQLIFRPLEYNKEKKKNKSIQKNNEKSSENDSSCKKIKDVLCRIGNKDTFLNPLISGIIDGDKLTDQSKKDKKNEIKNLNILDRYEKENYILDPLYVLFINRKQNGLKDMKVDENINLENINDLNSLLEKNEDQLNKLLEEFRDYIKDKFEKLIQLIISEKSNESETANFDSFVSTRSKIKNVINLLNKKTNNQFLKSIVDETISENKKDTNKTIKQDFNNFYFKCMERTILKFCDFNNQKTNEEENNELYNEQTETSIFYISKNNQFNEKKIKYPNLFLKKKGKHLKEIYEAINLNSDYDYYFFPNDDKKESSTSLNSSPLNQQEIQEENSKGLEVLRILYRLQKSWVNSNFQSNDNSIGYLNPNLENFKREYEGILKSENPDMKLKPYENLDENQIFVPKDIYDIFSKLFDVGAS